MPNGIYFGTNQTSTMHISPKYIIKLRFIILFAPKQGTYFPAAGLQDGLIIIF